MHPPYETAPSLDDLGDVRHGFFGRQGGVSEGEFASLNVSVSVGDAALAVAENRRRSGAALGLESGPPVLVRQVHGTRVHHATGPIADADRPEADALVTAVPGLALGILTADCVPVLLADPQARVIGAAHAGWRGAVEGVVGATVAAMRALGADPDRIRAAIGPAITAQNYEVGDTFAQALNAEHPQAVPFLVEGPNAPHFDVPGLVLAQLQAAGITADRVGGCTYAQPERYFSHRRATHDGTRTGRQIAMIVLE